MAEDMDYIVNNKLSGRGAQTRENQGSSKQSFSLDKGRYLGGYSNVSSDNLKFLETFTSDDLKTFGYQFDKETYMAKCRNGDEIDCC